ncbi:MAG: cytochrome c [Gammaproteobacteria bacterium]|nr:cytochrome c [Gammaproteobacteria bacterium]
MNKPSVLAIGVCCMALLWGAAAMAREKAADNYRTYCVQCHGLKGDGKGINIRDMSVQPRDHTDAKEMSARSDADIYKVIKEGGVAINKSVLMPPWSDVFSDEEIKDLVLYLRELCKCSYGK